MIVSICYFLIALPILRLSIRLFYSAYHLNENNVAAEQQYTISELVEKLKAARILEGQLATTTEAGVAALYSAEIDSEVIRTLSGKPWMSDGKKVTSSEAVTPVVEDAAVNDMTNVTHIWDAPNPGKHDDYDSDYDDDY
jgi:hypothetical protein